MTYFGRGPGVPITSFDDIDCAAPTPIVQLEFLYNINSYETTTSLVRSGTVTSSPPFAVVQSGATTSSSGSISSYRNVPYRAGQGTLYSFGAIFTTGVVGNVQLAGAGGTVNGLFFGYNGTVFSINRRSNGVDNWVAQSAWNVDPMNGTGTSRMTLNPALGNLYQILLGWLGFGNINFFVENPATGLFVLVHRIQYPNSATVTSIRQSTAPLYLSSANSTNATNISVNSPAMAGLVQGSNDRIGNLFSVETISGFTNSEKSVIILQNKTSFNNVINFKKIQMLSFSMATAVAGNQPWLVNIRLNPGFASPPAYVDVNTTQSCAAADLTTGRTQTAPGTLLFEQTMINNAVLQLNMASMGIYLSPGDVITCGGTQASGSNNVNCTFSWIEIF